ncbi:MAG: hypothetical protein ACTSPI_16745 [Candidatus Heimdallarchaeaceae archaeon]
MKLLHEKKISELEKGFYNGDEYFQFYDPKELKQWAIAVVKNIKNFRTTWKASMSVEEDYRKIYGMEIEDFLINRFEITEKDLKGD